MAEEASSDIGELTYETIYELVRRERARAEIQQLDGSFFVKAASFVQQKEAALREQEGKTDLFSADEINRLRQEIITTQKMLKHLYTLREDKIVAMTLFKIRAGYDAGDIQSLLPEERMLYDVLVDKFSFLRKEVLYAVLKGETPVVPGAAAVAERSQAASVIPAGMKQLRFLAAVPALVGKEMEPYGPFDAEETALLPNELADILVSQQQAEEVKG